MNRWMAAFFACGLLAVGYLWGSAIHLPPVGTHGAAHEPETHTVLCGAMPDTFQVRHFLIRCVNGDTWRVDGTHFVQTNDVVQVKRADTDQTVAMIQHVESVAEGR